MEPMQMISVIRPLMMKLRESDPTLAAPCRGGNFQLASVTYAGRRSTVTPLTEWMPFGEFVAMLQDRAA